MGLCDRYAGLLQALCCISDLLGNASAALKHGRCLLQVVDLRLLIFGLFDPFPFIFLNLMLSMLAAVQAPIILMSQNRQSAKDRLTAQHDYEVNLKAELEIMALHEKIDLMRNEQLAQVLAKHDEQIKLLTDLVKAKG